MPLSRSQIAHINALVDSWIARIKTRFLGPNRGAKTIAFQFDKEHSLPGLYAGAAAAEGHRTPDPGILRNLMDVASAHLEAKRHEARARVQRAVAAALDDPKRRPAVVLGGELADVGRDLAAGVKKVLETESTTARNAGTMDAAAKVAAQFEIDDPVGYFATVNDMHRCSECARLHLLEDGITPRVWRLSEIGGGYHRRGQANPKMSGLHPNCRCSWCTLLPNWGFKNGRVSFISLGHSELEKQRGG